MHPRICTLVLALRYASKLLAGAEFGSIILGNFQALAWECFGRNIAKKKKIQRLFVCEVCNYSSNRKANVVRHFRCLAALAAAAVQPERPSRFSALR